MDIFKIIIWISCLFTPPVLILLLKNKLTSFFSSMSISWIFLFCLEYYNFITGPMHYRIGPMFMSFGGWIPASVYTALWYAVLTAMKERYRAKDNSISPQQTNQESNVRISGLALKSLILSSLSFMTGPLQFILFITGSHLIESKVISFFIGVPIIMFCLPLFILGIIGGHLALMEIKKNPEIRGGGIASSALLIGYISFIIFVIEFLLFYAISHSFGLQG